MNILRAAAKVAAFLEEQRIPYAVIGGLAVQYWGEPRTTRDVDVVVLVSGEAEEPFLKAALRRFQPRVPDAFSFAQRHRVLLIKTAEGTPVDMSLGIPGYEEEVMHRAKEVRFPNGPPLRLISAEDLVIHKCVAGRARDMEDVERILIRQKLKMNLRYIRKWLKVFAPLVESHNVQEIFEDALKKGRQALRKRTR